VSDTDELRERHAVETALAESEARYRHLVESASDGIYRIDPAGFFLYANAIANRVLGGGPSIVGRHYLEFVRRDFHERANEFYRNQIKSRIPTTYFEFPALAADGSELWIGQKVQIEVSGNRVVALHAVARDISDRKRLEDELRQSNKMQTLGELAGGIAHDFNNLLMAIAGYTDLLRLSLAPSDPRSQDVAEIRKTVDRATALTRRLLMFSRRESTHSEDLDMNAIIVDMREMLARIIGDRVQIRTDLAAGLPLVRGDRNQIDQVLMNLVINARDAMPGGGTLTLATSLARPTLPASGNAPPTPRVVVSVKDTGIGMSDVVRTRLFEPFFTTKSHGKGTGLGLATVLGIVKQMGGAVEVDSEEGKGAEFRIILPTVDPLRSSLPLPSSHADTSTQKVIVLADDEEGIRNTLVRALEQKGYKVLAVPTGTQAMDLVERRGRPIDLLITDVAMPGVGGFALARRFSTLYPGSWTLLMSAYTDEEELRRQLASSQCAFLAKPFSIDELIGKVESVLASG
jgi:two-component system, cell cycle sensor histidine kinase and response regulator CckA